WHHQPPTLLRYVQVFNSVGQLVWRREYNGNANSLIPIDLSGNPSGLYFVHLSYTDAKRNVTEKVVKF
ncbi:MAG: T9SS type A sorting domain-containing protein, partial [Chitinophagaceae bacterium]|nr:T9SS type A sorting domain-containing protein [Chitinophagaceae bacterium]